MRNFVSKHFAAHLYPDCHQTIDLTFSSTDGPLAFWKEQTLQKKMQSMCFVIPCFIELVNRVNTKLLYGDLITSKSSKQLPTKEEP